MLYNKLKISQVLLSDILRMHGMDEKKAEDGALADFSDENLLKIAAQRVIFIWQVNLSPG